MQITRSSIETTTGPAEWFTGSVYLDAVAAPTAALTRAGEQRPLHARRAHGLAHAPERADDLRHRGRRPLPAPRRPARDDPARRPRLLRARRGALARRAPGRFMAHLAMVQVDEDGTRRLGRARHRRGVRRRAGGVT